MEGRDLNNKIENQNQENKTSETRRLWLKETIGLIITVIFGGKFIRANVETEQQRKNLQVKRQRTVADIARNYLERAYTGDTKLFKELVANDCTLYGGDHVERAKGPDAIRKFLDEGEMNAFPDARVRVLEIIESDDKVVVRWEASGTNLRSYKGHRATGRRAKVGGMSILTIKGGKIVKDRYVYDSKELYAQLGIAKFK